MGIGLLKYRLPRNTLVDLAGIAQPRLPRYRREAAAAGAPLAGDQRFLEETRPDYLVIFPKWFPFLLAEGSPFRPVYRISIPDNITMGDDSIVVLSTPWTRYSLEGTPAHP
jgi:hypothetical protein